MGFWQTGYWEFHEEVGLEKEFTPTPPVYRCEHCEASFDHLERLRTHRFESHPARKPALFIRGREIGTMPLRIVRSLKASDVETAQATEALINNISTPTNRLGPALSKARTDVVNVVLRNEQVSAAFQLCFQVASEEDLKGVERALLDLARGRTLDLRAVEQFIDACRHFPTAISYCDGICEYFYGVLAKDRSGHVPAHDYIERFNAAIDALAAFERPLSNAICGIIAMHFNQFEHAAQLAPAMRVGATAQRFDRWVRGISARKAALSSDMEGLSIERMLTDMDSEKILSWAAGSLSEALAQCEQIEAFALSGIATYDVAKLRLLLATACQVGGRIDEAKRHAREIVNAPNLQRCAERILALEVGR